MTSNLSTRKPPPAFQFYASDWLGSTRIALMTAEQERGYLRLLLHCWNDPTCSLPDDDSILSKLSLMGEGWFKGGSALVRECFTPFADQPGRITNKRLLEVRQKNDEWREKSSLGGKKSAEARKQTGLTSNKQKSRVVEPPYVPKAQPNGNSPSPSPSPIYTPIAPFSDKLVDGFDCQRVRNAFTAWFQHLSQLGKQVINPHEAALRACQFFSCPDELCANIRFAIQNEYKILKRYDGAWEPSDSGSQGLPPPPPLD